MLTCKSLSSFRPDAFHSDRDITRQIHLTEHGQLVNTICGGGGWWWVVVGYISTHAWAPTVFITVRVLHNDEVPIITIYHVRYLVVASIVD